jgi:ribonuclease HI
METFKCTFDGCAEPNPGIMGCGWTINNESFSCSPGSGTSNEAEYHALINLLVALLDRVRAGDCLEICGDSELIIRQINGDYAVKAWNLQQLWKQANAHMLPLRERGCAVSLDWHPREENALADAASKRAIGIDLEKEKAFRVAPGYGTLSEAAKLAGCSAVMVGRVLDNLGYRDGGKPTQKAWDERLVSEHFPNSWMPYSTKDWHIERVAGLVRSAALEQRKASGKPAKPKIKMIVLEGNAYPHREAIKAAGGKWDTLGKVWRVPESEHARLTQLVENQ